MKTVNQVCAMLWFALALYNYNRGRDARATFCLVLALYSFEVSK